MKKLAPLFWIACFFGVGVAAFFSTPPLGDERTHYDQIIRLAGNHWHLSPFLSMLPGYHVVVALAARFLDVSSFLAIRLIAAGIGAASAAAVWWAARGIRGEDAAHKTARLALLPLLFPFFFLVYTDIFSLGLLALAVGLAVRNKDIFSGLAALAALAVRQSNVVWLIFLFGWIYLREEGLRVEPRAVLGQMRRGFVFIFGVFIFAAFVVWNGGVSISLHDLTPTGHFSFGNVHMGLFLFFILFFPEVCRALPGFAQGAKREPVLAILIALWAMIGFVLFKPDHPFNAAEVDFFWRNRVLELLSASVAAKAAYFTAGALALATIASTSFSGPGTRTLFALCSLAFLWPQWLVEPRYVIIPFAFYVLYREEVRSRGWRLFEIGWSIAWAVPATYFMSRGAFFP